MERFTEREKAHYGAKVEKANVCRHDWFLFKPVCNGFDVATDTEYRVHGCRSCDARGDITLDGSVFRVYVPTLPNERLKTQDGAFYDDPAIYNPQHDGIDAATDTREPFFTNLFDTRGGAGGIGD